ncbi:MAG: replication-associated recombination protein A [Candidatus Aureabacteria bacterium]|nr:replication-associated recombination protein A [Candidatus Auribacterota bacterium]
MENETLFEKVDHKDDGQALRPLSYRMRPETFEQFAGQEHILGKGKILRRMIEHDCFQSVVLWGPPGCGKNSLASMIALMTKRDFVSINAVEANTSHLRKTVETSRFHLQQSGRRTLLFIDEIHRFNKAQQDLLLPYVEAGDVVLIGATTHNPVFSLISPLRSRSHIFELKALKKDDIRKILNFSLEKENERLKRNIKVEKGAFDLIVEKCGGDARIALNTLETAISTTDKKSPAITVQLVSECLPYAAVRYDKDESEHYDTISIFIKSLRGSDPDAALYWLGKMISAGEDPLFIARRLAIFASEDIGMADPRALIIADSTMRLVGEIGLPESRIILSQAVIYMATAQKSNASYMAIDSVLQEIQSQGVEHVPEFVRKTPSERTEEYKYSHDFRNGISGQDYREAEKIYYNPKDTGYESIIRKRIGLWRKIKSKKKSGKR